jgi:hypothetical protein
MKKMKIKDKGYIIAFVAILILPLLGFTSFSVDLGSWYAKAAELQRATDAAALGGAAFLPNKDKAEAKAKSITAMNGFEHNPPAVIVDVQIPPKDPTIIIVTITLDEFPRYFSQIFSNDNLSFSRTSRAEYLPAPKMGSPRNFLGTGYCYNGGSDTGGQAAGTIANGPFSLSNNCPASARENWWLSVNYACTPRQSADRFASYIDGTAQSVTGGPGSTVSGQCQTKTKQTFSNGSAYFAENPEYDREGYFYGITIKAPPSTSASYVLEGFSMGQGSRLGSTNLCQDGPAVLTRTNDTPEIIETKGEVAEDDAFTVKWNLFYNNAFDPRVEPISSFPVEVKPSNCGNFSGWYSFNNFPLVAEPGETKTYWLQVQPKPHDELTANGATPQLNSGRGVNVFSLRVRKAGSSFTACSSLAGDTVTYDEYCPELYGVENLPTLTTFDFTSNNSERSFFLAQLPDEYVNRTVSVEVFDPDPFSKSVSILNEGAPPGQQLQEFTPRILCRDGRLAVNEVCGSFNQKVAGGGVRTITENAPSGTSGGRPISYNNMSKTTAFEFFKGPAPLPSSTFCLTAPNSCETWFNAASNTSLNAGQSSLWGLSNRTLRMTFTVPEPAETDTNNWWKINFMVYNNISSLPTDRMTWSLKVSGEPVRLLPNQIPYDLLPNPR